MSGGITTYMSTQINKRNNESKMYFIEPAVWKKGEVIMTVAVGEKEQLKSPVGYIILDGYNENERPVFSSRDLEGHVIFETTVNLYQLKRLFRDNEAALTQAMEEYEISREALLEDLQQRALLEPEPERDNDDELMLDQPDEDYDNSEQESTPENEKQRELKVVHRKKDREKHLAIER
jgi:hypothetical protein